MGSGRASPLVRWDGPPSTGYPNGDPELARLCLRFCVDALQARAQGADLFYVNDMKVCNRVPRGKSLALVIPGSCLVPRVPTWSKGGETLMNLNLSIPPVRCFSHPVGSLRPEAIGRCLRVRQPRTNRHLHRCEFTVPVGSGFSLRLSGRIKWCPFGCATVRLFIP